MRKLIMFSCAVTLVFGMMGTARAMMYTDTHIPPIGSPSDPTGVWMDSGGAYPTYSWTFDITTDGFDPVTQDVLANFIGQAALMILPSGYPETCGNSILQSLVSGTPVITTGNLGATPEWVKHKKNGMLTEYLPHDYMVHIVEMVRNAECVLKDEKLHQRLIRGATRTKILNWFEVGAKWEKMLNGL